MSKNGIINTISFFKARTHMWYNYINPDKNNPHQLLRAEVVMKCVDLFKPTFKHIRTTDDQMVCWEDNGRIHFQFMEKFQTLIYTLVYHGETFVYYVSFDKTNDIIPPTKKGLPVKPEDEKIHYYPEVIRIVQQSARFDDIPHSLICTYDIRHFFTSQNSIIEIHLLLADGYQNFRGLCHTPAKTHRHHVANILAYQSLEIFLFYNKLFCTHDVSRALLYYTQSSHHLLSIEHRIIDFKG